VDGPWGKVYRPMLTVGGLKDAWPLFAIAAGIATLMGMFYFWMLNRYAGVIIALSMVFTTLACFAMGVFFCIAVLMDMEDTTSDYAKFNPISSVYIGTEAQVYSFITGAILILISLLGGALMCISIGHVDEVVGLIQASVECLDKSSLSLKIYPFLSSAAFLVLFIVFTFIGLPYVMSLGSLDYTEISVNGEGIEGLQRVWKRSWIQDKELFFYCIGIVYMLEFYVQFGHYVVSYTVASWYFLPGKPMTVDNNKNLMKGLGGGTMGGKKVEVRVGGIDPNYGPRQGNVVMTQAGKMLVVPVGRKGPGLGRLDMETETFWKPDLPCGRMLSGVLSGFVYHVGTIMYGTPIIFFLRPFRIMSKIMHAFLDRTKDPEPHWNAHEAHHRDPRSDTRKNVSLVSQCIDQILGRFGKDAFTELALTGCKDFFYCANESFEFLIKSGGSIVHLHGSMMLYEIFGSLFIALLCTIVTMILQDKLSIFNDNGEFHIEDKNASTVACFFVSLAIGHTWMSTWGQIGDTLLYCVAWNRKQLKQGVEHKMPRVEMIAPVNEFCPQHLRYLLPPHERDVAYEGGVKSAGGMGHAMQILTTMEQGATTALGSVAGGAMKTLGMGDHEHQSVSPYGHGK